MDKLLTVDRVAHVIGRSSQAVRKGLQRGWHASVRLPPALKIGWKWFFSAAEVERWQAARRAALLPEPPRRPKGRPVNRFKNAQAWDKYLTRY